MHIEIDFNRMDDSPAAIRDYLAESGIAARKRWGQNFLFDRPARRMLADLVEPAPGRRIWEVGAGLGAMTAHLLAGGAAVTAFEIDHGMIRHLHRRFAGCDRLRVVEGDAARRIPELRAGGAGEPDALLGNLPYNSAAAILWASMADGPPIGRIVCTVQREMAERMCALPGTRSFGPFSVLCSLEHRARIARRLPGGCFYPRPNVESAVVVLDAAGAPPQQPRARVLALAEAAFAQPRKTLANNLKSLPGSREEAERRLMKVGVNPRRRPATLDMEEIMRLSAAFAEFLPEGAG